MVVVPGDFKISGKPWNRLQLLPKGWNVPPGNILAAYLVACQKLKVSATSGMIEVLSRRKCLMSPLPYHVLADCSKADKIQYILAWSDFRCTQQLPWEAFRQIISVIAPLMTDEELSNYYQASTYIGLDECHHIIGRILRVVSTAESDHSLLEILAMIPQFELLPRTSKFRAAFRLLDVDHSGRLDLSEVNALLPWLAPEIASTNHKASRDLLQCMDTNGDQGIDVDEFLAFMDTALSDASDEIVDKRVQALVEERLAGRFHFDFSGSYCGRRGVLPLIAALTIDRTFESLDLSGCGIDNDGTELLAALLATHPAIKTVNLSNNRISEHGIRALARMLQSNQAIIDLDVSGNLCDRGFSCMNHCSERYSESEAMQLLHSCLIQNQQQAGTPLAMALTVLHEHLHDLRALFTELMDHTGRVPYPKLQAAVADVARDWGLNHDTVKGLLRPEGILTAVHAVSHDASGELMLARGEFLAALDSRAVEKRVCRTIQLHLVEVKKQFYQRASSMGVTCCGKFEDAADGWKPHDAMAMDKLSHEAGNAHGQLPHDPWSQQTSALHMSAQDQTSVHCEESEEVRSTHPVADNIETAKEVSSFHSVPEKVYAVVEVDATGIVNTSLHVGKLPDPHAADPSTPPMASVAVDLEQVYELLDEQIRDPANGWGVLMEDVRTVLKPERFTENAGARTLPTGKVTWALFVRTVLYLLNR
eukprot:jgi/Ulvmu1/3123/UM015_0163.1